MSSWARGIGRRPPWLRLRRDGERWWLVAATLIAIAATITAVVALLLHQFGTSWQPTVLLTAVSHQLMWAAPVAVIAAVAARRWVTTGVASAACVLVAAVQIPPNLASGAHDGSGREVVVLQANLKIGGADPDALTSLVRDRRVDLLATEELTDREEAALVAAGLPGLLPHRYTAPLPTGGGGIGIWSRFPLSDTQNVDGYSAGLLTVRVQIGAGFTFVAVHVGPPYRQPFETWLGEIAALRGTLRGLPNSMPVVAAGDFNATVDHAQYRDLLTGGYRDAADEAGAGYLATYPDDRWFGPVIGIDHVLIRGELGSTSADTMSVPGTDHRVLLVHIVLD